MDALNYHHLRYFWVVAREGGLVPAARRLRLSHPTLSTQIRALEAQLGEKLFEKQGRRLALTPTGRVVSRYAEEIFALGRELVLATQGKTDGKPLRLVVGVVDAVPKTVARKLLEPAFALDQPVRVVCYENTYERLLADLASHTLDVVIADAPVPAGSHVRAFHRLLGESDVSFFAIPKLARSLRARFPGSLHGAPLVLPTEGSPLRRAIDAWLAKLGITPRITAELEDSALLKAFGADGIGVFPAPSVVASEVMKQHGVERVGRASELRERFYAVSIERRIKHPAVAAITERAQTQLSAEASGRARVRGVTARPDPGETRLRKGRARA
jgi:LysR family transcriptional activator of nhaA